MQIDSFLQFQDKRRKIIDKSKDDRFAKTIGNIVFDKKNITPQKRRALHMLHLGQKKRDCNPESHAKNLFKNEDISIDNEVEVEADIIPPNEESLEVQHVKRPLDTALPGNGRVNSPTWL